jgi:hypothetical protein
LGKALWRSRAPFEDESDFRLITRGREDLFEPARFRPGFTLCKFVEDDNVVEIGSGSVEDFLFLAAIHKRDDSILKLVAKEKNGFGVAVPDDAEGGRLLEAREDEFVDFAVAVALADALFA